MRALFILDPIERLHFIWDTSLFILKEFFRRRHLVFVAYAEDITSENGQIVAAARQITDIFEKSEKFRISNPSSSPITKFDLVLIRKEPPFDATYLYLTYLLEMAADKVPMVNHPRGIRNINEKLAILNFPSLIPETLVASSVSKILEFQRRLKIDLVLKPLNLMGGKNIVRVKYGSRKVQSILRKTTQNEKEYIMAQRFLETGTSAKGKDKRILLVNGEVLTAFEKRPPKGDFRSNLSLGGTAHPTDLTPTERKLVKTLKPYLMREGLFFAGVDILCEKLIEINVTCPSGLSDATGLYPRRGLGAEWADALEKFASCR